MLSDRQSRQESLVDEDPLGPIATMAHPAATLSSTVPFGAREAALAGSDDSYAPGMAFTWHITCSSITLNEIRDFSD